MKHIKHEKFDVFFFTLVTLVLYMNITFTSSVETFNKYFRGVFRTLPNIFDGSFLRK